MDAKQYNLLTALEKLQHELTAATAALKQEESKQHDKVCEPCPDSCGTEKPEDCKIVKQRVMNEKEFKLEITNQLKTLITEKLVFSPDTELTDNARIVNDLNADSLDTVELIMAAEDFFNIEIEDENVEKVLTIQDSVNLIYSKLILKQNCDLLCDHRHSEKYASESHCFHSQFLNGKCETSGACHHQTKKTRLNMIDCAQEIAAQISLTQTIKEIDDVMSHITIQSYNSAMVLLKAMKTDLSVQQEQFIDLLKKCRHNAEFGYRNSQLVDEIDEQLTKM